MATEVGRRTRPGRARRNPHRKSSSIRSTIRTYVFNMVRTGRLPAFLLSVGLGVLLAGLLTTDDFLVDEVVVRGNSIAYVDSVVSQSEALGAQIFMVDTDDVARRVASHPAVYSAEVSAALPDRLRVQVVERTGALVWVYAGQSFLVDQYGVVLAEAVDESLPTVHQHAGDAPEIGARLSPDLVTAYLHLKEVFGPRATLAQAPEDGIIVILENGREIIFGTENETPAKIAVVNAVRSDDDTWSSLDVRDPTRPVLRGTSETETSG